MLEEKEHEFAVLLQNTGISQQDKDLPRCLSTIAWSYATLMLHKPKTLECVGRLAIRKTILESFKPFEFSNLLWAFAKARIDDGQVWWVAQRQVAKMLHEFKPASLSIISWAFAKSCAKSCVSVPGAP